MEKIDNILRTKYPKNPFNDSNDNINNIENIVNNDNNGNDKTKGKYALDRSKFIPNTEETQLAEEIATSFDDLQNYAFYFSIAKKLGVTLARTDWKNHKQEEEEKRGTKYEFRNSKKYFAWKFKKGYHS